MWQWPPEGNAMHPFSIYDFARERQREILAEAEQIALAKSARAGSNKSRRQPTFLLRVVLILVLVGSAWTLLS
jgi:hypothetical protein